MSITNEDEYKAEFRKGLSSSYEEVKANTDHPLADYFAVARRLVESQMRKDYPEFASVSLDRIHR